MAQQTINIGTYANKGDGDPIRVAFTKVNANFTDLYARVVVLEGGGVAVAQDIQGDIFAQDSSLAYSSATNTHYGSFVGALDGDVTGSVFADNSTLIIDGVAGTINSSVLVGTLPAIDGSNLTNLPTPAVTGTYNGPTATITDYVGIDNPYEAALPQYDSSVGGWTSLKFPLYGNSTDNDVAIFDTAQGGWVNSALKTIDGNSILGSGDIAVISLATLKTEVAASADFADFQTRIAAL